MSYEFRTDPFEHQRRVFEETAMERAYGLFWEQGTGKTKAIIDTAAYLYEQDEIDTLVVVAPNGVHRNWITDEIPVHMPRRHARDIQMKFWESKKTGTQTHARDVKRVTDHDGFRIMAFNYEAMLTKKGELALKHLFVGHKVLLVFDESHYIKTPRARRTMRAIALAKKAAYVRILTGTPIANSPFDAYSQLKALDPDYWKQHGFSVFSTFKTHFGIFQQGFNSGTGRTFETCVGYRRLDQLKALLDPVTDRVTKDDVLDLPPKLYQRAFFELTPEQLNVYKQIKNEAIAFLESGETITAPMAMVRLLRLQQVTCGFVPTDDDQLEEFEGKNPRLDKLEEICDTLGHSAIIWARFRRDIDLIMERLGDRAVRYDGSTTDDERAEAKQRFQAGDVQFFVGNPAAGATGLTLHKARTVIYASNNFKLTDRLQSEDRAHRIGQEHPVAYIDLIAPGTVDEHIVRALRNKRDIASELTGDELKEWI
jgi:SNF2 family DNA or RNA helicase